MSDLILEKMRKLDEYLTMIGDTIHDAIDIEREMFDLVSEEDREMLEVLEDGQVIMIDGEYRFAKGENPDAEFLHDMDTRRRENMRNLWANVTLSLASRAMLLDFGIQMRSMLER